ncbi:S9 family peptidase [Siculibacillus lacustris]|uniref:S9 family peptidase n=1 Tax=Siculibacillus lacustris TaxID=1549641 RepID=A0A4Q9VZA9_9HYPH|nr:S9 family peptidase [Siculibacillus lacustris]TBW41009.1 S9 family peptidase [Siculibacillus lacustris]
MTDISWDAGLAAPEAARRPTMRHVHGVALGDDYAWLRADNWREVMRDPNRLDPEIRAHLDAENAYCAAMLAGTEALQTRLYAEAEGRIKQDDSSVPAPDGPWAYGLRFAPGGQHPIHVRSPRDGGPEEILLDGDARAAGTAYFRLSGVVHAPDHRRIVWGADENGSEFFTLRVRDLTMGVDLDDRIEETGGEAVWAADGQSFFYVRLDAEHRPSRVLRHVIGRPSAEDSLVYEEADAGFFVGLDKTRSGAFVVISVHDHETSEALVIPADAPATPPRLIAPRITAEEYEIEHCGDAFVILTNHGGAEDFQILTTPIDATARDSWRPLVPHVAGRLILSMIALADHLVRLERVDGLPRLIVRRLADGAEHAIAFDEEAYSLGASAGYEFATTTLRFTYSSMTTPVRVWDYDLETRDRVLRKEQEVPSGHDPAAYVTRRLQIVAPDGETVPVSVLHRRDTPIDGSAPALLYGYGAYGIAIPAAFSTDILSLVDRGFVYAIAHVRGGKDKGWRWYALGRREHKTNTFDDFVTAADGLIAHGFTAAGRIVARGGSAGGMLMGAVANRAGALFGGIVAEVPFVDVLTTMLDASLPLTPPEWPEWGNPIEDEAAFRTILGYSPYDNVAAQPYPPILALAGLTDPRVTYWEPAKWVAKLRATRTDDRPVLLKTDMDSGHGGAAGRFARLKDVALVQAFALLAVGRAGA